MIEVIRQEFIKVIQESEWMDTESKELALAKVRLIKISLKTKVRKI